MATFVLVHGACHGAWCWFKLVPELEAQGHRVVPIDLPGLGEDRTPVEKVTFDGTIDHVVKVVGKEAEPVILLGHSLGGVSISATAERIPERVKLLVYLAAFLPRDGDSVNAIYETPDWPQESDPRTTPIKSADGTSFWHTPETARQRFYHDCPEEDVAYCIAHLRPQPSIMRQTPVRITPERFGRVPRAYVHTLDDRASPIARQRQMVANSPCQFVLSLPTSHSPFVSAPKVLAEKLGELARA